LRCYSIGARWHFDRYRIRGRTGRCGAGGTVYSTYRFGQVDAAAEGTVVEQGAVRNGLRRSNTEAKTGNNRYEGNFISKHLVFVRELNQKVDVHFIYGANMRLLKLKTNLFYRIIANKYKHLAMIFY